MFSANQTLLLRILSAAPDREWTMSELAEAMGKKPGGIQRGLNSLVESGHIDERRLANLRLLRYNSGHPLQEEIRRIANHPRDALPTDVYLRHPPATGGSLQVAEPRGAYDAAALKVLVIAGPNGAGKTTFAKEYLQNEARCPHFINADYIAHGLSPFAPRSAALKAGRLMVRELVDHFRQRRSVAVETTLSGRRYARLIPEWQKRGYKVKLIFLALQSVDLAIARVESRARQGGHPIPEATIRRRYEVGRLNFDTIYKHLVDGWALYDNSGDQLILLDEGER